MPRYEHLPLRRIEGELPRRKRGGGRPPVLNPAEHGPKIGAEVVAVLEGYQQTPRIDDVDPALVLRVRTGAPVDEEDWRRAGMSILATDPNNALVMFANDRELTEFRRRVQAYQEPLSRNQKHPQYAGFINAIEELREISPSDRIGPALKAEGMQSPEQFQSEEHLVVDVELWQPNDEEVDRFIYRVTRRVEALGGTITNTYRGRAAVLLRVDGTGAVIQALLQLPEVASVDLPPLPDFLPIDTVQIAIGDIGQIEAPEPTSLIIGVIDSGISSAHPLLEPAVVGAFGVPQELGDDDAKGHGTFVSSIAIYGDVNQRLNALHFRPRFRVASAKVLNAEGRFDNARLVPNQMEEAIRRLHAEYGCKVINISLADIRHPVKAKPGAWAAVLDELARELDLIIVVPTGNSDPRFIDNFGDGIIAAYPSYLLNPQNRMLEPASGFNVVTVGSITHSNGMSQIDEGLVGVRPIALRDQPSPFTRTGPGIRQMSKPDFVDYGGTAIFDGATQTVMDGTRRSPAGILGFHHQYLERLFATRSGTSFATALVGYKMAILRETFPGASANLTRALSAVSSDPPVPSIECLHEQDDETRCHALGFGMIDIDRALASDDNRVILFREDTLPTDRFAVYEVPIPEVFQNTSGTRQIRVVLAFDPPVRHSRLDYAGISMGFHLLRGISPADVFSHFRAWRKAEGRPFKVADRFKCTLTPGPQRRERGTLQCGTFKAERSLAGYGDRYFLAVRCERGWAPEQIREQRFAVVVELRHQAQIQLYERLRVRLKA